MSQLLFECFWKLVPHMQVCAFWPPVFWQRVACLNIVLISNAVEASNFHSSFYTRMGWHKCPLMLHSSAIMRSLPSIPENCRRVCTWIRCVDIEQQFSIARNQWSEQQFLQLTTAAGLWDVCQFIVAYNRKYKKSAQQKHIGRVMIWQAAHLHSYYIMTMKVVSAIASRLHTYIYIYIYKAIPLQAWTGRQGSRRLRLPDFMTIGTWRW